PYQQLDAAGLLARETGAFSSLPLHRLSSELAVAILPVVGILALQPPLRISSARFRRRAPIGRADRVEDRAGWMSSVVEGLCAVHRFWRVGCRANLLQFPLQVARGAELGAAVI